MMKGHCHTSSTDLFQLLSQRGEARDEREIWARSKKLREAGILSDLGHSMSPQMSYFATEQIQQNQVKLT